MAKKDPFEDDDGDDKAADKAAVESVKDKVAERQEARAAPEGDFEIDVDKAEEELEEQDPARESRNDRRRNRYREMQAGRDADKKRADEAERRERETRELMLQLQRTQAQLQAPQQPQQPKEDPLDEEMARAFAEQDMLYRDYNARAASLTGQEHAEFASKLREYQRKIVVTGGKIALRDSGIQQGGNERQIRAAVTAQRLQDEAGDVLGDERKRMYMDGVWRQLVASGRKDDWSTLTDAAEATRRKFGMPTKTRQTPSDSYKRKLSGAARGAGGGSSEPRVVVMNEAYKAMADASYRHIKNPAERYKRWAAGAGAKLLEKGGR